MLRPLCKTTPLIQQLLAQDPAHAKINSEFEKAYVKRCHDPYWYEQCGVQNIKQTIKQIAKQVGMERDYALIYGPFSGVIHGGDMWNSVKFVQDGVEVNALRDATDVLVLFRTAVNLALLTFKRILKEYLPGEHLAKKYFEEWRERYRKSGEADPALLIEPRSDNG